MGERATAPALNQDRKEELYLKSPFEIYFGRKPNFVAQTGDSHTEEWDAPLDKYEEMVRPRPRDYRGHFKNIKAKRTQALSATEKCANRMIEREGKNILHQFITLVRLFLSDILTLVVS